MNKLFRAVLLAASLVASASRVAEAAPADGGGGLNFAILAAQIHDALQRHSAEVTLAPGVYRSTVPVGCAAHLSIIAAKNLRIIADGVTMICTRRTRAIEIRDCDHLTIQGLTIDYDPLPFTQGRVIALADGGASVDVQLDAGYPRALFNRIDLIDRNTRTRKRGMPFLWGAVSSWADETNGVVRVHHQNLRGIAEVGDLVSLSNGPDPDGSPHGITIDNCAATTLSNVTIYSAPGMGVIETDGEGGSHIVGCHIEPGPPPPGATAPRLLSTSWDAIMTSVVRHGPLIEHCVITDAGDDSWSMQSADDVVIGVSGKSLIVAQRAKYCDGPQVGDRLRTSLDAPEVVITSRQRIKKNDPRISAEATSRLNSAKKWGLWDVSDQYLALTIDRDASVAVGQSVYDPDRVGDGFIFRDNEIHSPGRGALITGGGGLIENNRFIDVHSAVTIALDTPEGGAYGIKGIDIRGNTINGSGYFCPGHWSKQVGAVSIGAGEDVTVEGNRFEDVNGINVFINGARGIKVLNNEFRKTHQTPPNNTGADFHIDQRALVWIGESQDILIQGNLLSDPGPFGGKYVVEAGAVERLQGTTAGIILDSHSSH